MRGRRCARGTRDSGSGSVLFLGVVGVLLLLTVASLALGAAHVAAQRAASAADLAALAGASRLRDGGTSVGACAAARGVALANGAELLGCRVSRREVEVRVSIRPAVGPGEAVGRSRAGPGPPAPR